MMCNVRGSARYKMILLNYLEPAISCVAGVDSQDGTSAFLSESERRGQGSLGPVLDVESGSSLTVGSLERLGSGWAGPPSLRLLAFHAMVVRTLGLCVDRSQREPPPRRPINTIRSRPPEPCWGR